jgi:hypothetical protein
VSISINYKCCLPSKKKIKIFFKSSMLRAKMYKKIIILFLLQKWTYRHIPRRWSINKYWSTYLFFYLLVFYFFIFFYFEKVKNEKNWKFESWLAGINGSDEWKELIWSPLLWQISIHSNCCSSFIQNNYFSSYCSSCIY